MECNLKTIDEEALKQLLLRQKNTEQPFSLPISKEDLTKILATAYKVEVETRGGTADMSEAEIYIMALAEILIDHPKRGVMMSGVCGNGKTTLVKALRSALSILSMSGMIDKSYGLLILTAREISRRMAENENCEVHKSKLLAIEDLGIEPTEMMRFGNVMTPMLELFEYRYNSQLFTVITTNLTPSQVREKYGARIADRFNEMLNVLIFRNGTYRGK